MRFFAAAFVAFTSFVPQIGQAEDNPVVVELFTSQGCSSCPPADQLMQKLAKRDDVIALALHVDYWDYIGWKDSFADPTFTARQKHYAHVGGRRMIYTPQMIVNGTDDVVGARSMELADLIMTHKDTPDRARISGGIDGGSVKITVEAIGPYLNGPLDIHLVRYQPEQMVSIKSGENAGRDIRYVNIVRDWSVIGQWNGAAPADIEFQLDGDLPAAILVQRRVSNGPGPIVAAMRLAVGQS